MALLSPGIQLFESSVTPAAAVVAAENGVATLGFSTRGPINKLTKINSISEFNEIFGEPVKSNYNAHILTQAVLANNTDAYFMRIVDDTEAREAKCPVVDFKIKGAQVAIKDNISKLYSGYFMAYWDPQQGGGATSPTAPVLRVSYLKKTDDGEVWDYVDTPMQYSEKFSPAPDSGNHKYVLWIPINNVINNIAKSDSTLKNCFKFSEVSKISETDPEIGILVKAKNEKLYDSNFALQFKVQIGNVDSASPDGFIDWAAGSEVGPKNKISDYPEILDGTGDKTEFGGEELRVMSTLNDFISINNHSRFELTAKYPGSSMDNFKVTKKTVTSVNGKKSWTITVYDGEKAIESKTITDLSQKGFIEKMGDFAYIDVEEVAPADGSEVWTWENDGTWVLSKGELLANGEYWDGGAEGDYVVQEGDDGYPTVTEDGKKQYNPYKASVIYLEALGKDDWINTDENSFSILAIPSCQDTLVQNAAVEICAARGDAIFLADVPEELCYSKEGIDDIVEWANGNSGFQSSYCAIYYGWFYQTNPYDTDNSIACPASCFIAPKMVALDQSMGEFYAPAGITRGTLICSDWGYSPDQKDRDKLVGNDNVVNPISYSNTRGVTVMAQKTTDRTTSPLNRVGIRRMTNMIKRNLRSRLVALLFEPNNEVARSRARTIVDDIMSGLRTSDCIETYDIEVVSGTGANRNDLNVYLSFAPYGLIEKIYVYLSITDAGVEVSETVA